MTMREFVRTRDSVQDRPGRCRCDECGHHLVFGSSNPRAAAYMVSDDTGTFPVCKPCKNRHF